MCHITSSNLGSSIWADLMRVSEKSSFYNLAAPPADRGLFADSVVAIIHTFKATPPYLRGM